MSLSGSTLGRFSGSDSKLGRFSGAKAGDTRTFKFSGDTRHASTHRTCTYHMRILSSGNLGEITLVIGVAKRPGKDPLTRTESLVLTRLPPRTVADSVSIQWSSEVKP